jgi:hypothetical protein
MDWTVGLSASGSFRRAFASFLRNTGDGSTRKPRLSEIEWEHED